MFESFVGEKERNDASFSGFFTSTSSCDSSNDIGDNTISVESDRSSGQLSADSSFDMRQSTLSAKDADDSKPLSPKFDRLVDPMNGFPKFSILNQLKRTPDDEGMQQKICSSGLSNTVFDGWGAELPSGFWGRILDSWCYGYYASDSYRESSKLFNPESSLHFLQNLPVSSPLVLQTQGSGDKS